MNGAGNHLFEKLFERYYQKVFSFFVRRGFPPEEAEDLTQATFLRVFASMGTYRGGSDQRDRAFLMRVTDSVWKNELRRRNALKRGQRPESLDDPETPISERATRPLFGAAPPGPEEAADWTETVARLRREIQALPPRMRRVVMLRAHGLSYRELATAMRSSVDAVKKLLYEARKRLKKDLGPEAADLADEP